MEVELEKMVAKQKFDNKFSESESKDDSTVVNSPQQQVSQSRHNNNKLSAAGHELGTKINSNLSEIL